MATTAQWVYDRAIHLMDEQSEAGGQTEYGIINPAVDLDTLVQVYIIKEFDVVE